MLRLAASMWTGKGKPPLEYTKLILCRDIFHCTPSQLAEEDALEMMDLLAMHSEEHRLIDLRAKAQANKARR